jgi:hypothetical protein
LLQRNKKEVTIIGKVAGVAQVNTGIWYDSCSNSSRKAYQLSQTGNITVNAAYLSYNAAKYFGSVTKPSILKNNFQ